MFGPGPQAALMGWFATSGSFSRIILPIISGYLDRSVHNSPFNIVLFMLALSYLGVILLKSNMKMYIEIESTQNQIERRQIQDPNAGIWRPFSSMKRLWIGLNRQEQIQTIVMIFLMVFSIVDIIQMSGGSSRQDGYDIGEDLGLDVD